jgi:2-dehydropantoate 2-reductase
VMQNGYGLEQELAALFPDRVILGGLCFLCAERVGPAHVQHLDYGSVRIGPLVRDGRETPFMAALAADFATAGIETHLLQDLLLARWQKLMWNIPFNGLCALLGANTLELLENADSYALVAEMMAEVQSGAAACGVELSDAFVEKMLRDTRKMVPYKPSMQLDHEAGRPLEWEAIYQKPIEAAQANGALMPKCETLMRQLAFLSRER